MVSRQEKRGEGKNMNKWIMFGLMVITILVFWTVMEKLKHGRKSRRKTR